MQVKVTVEVSHEEEIIIDVDDNELGEWNNENAPVNSDMLVEFLEGGDPYQEVYPFSQHYSDPTADYTIRNATVML